MGYLARQIMTAFWRQSYLCLRQGLGQYERGLFRRAGQVIAAMYHHHPRLDSGKFLFRQYGRVDETLPRRGEHLSKEFGVAGLTKEIPAAVDHVVGDG